MIRRGLGGSQPASGGSERGPLESEDFMRSQKKLYTRYVILSPEFGDICTVDLVCPCMHKMLLIGMWKSHQAGYVSTCGKLSFETRPALAMPSVMVYPMEGYTT